MDRVLEVFKKALERVEDGLIQGPSAVTSTGVHTGYNSNEACAWCMWGAIKNAVYEVVEIPTAYPIQPEEQEKIFKIVSDIILEAYGDEFEDRKFGARYEAHVINFNEAPGRIVEEVKAVLSLAIAGIEDGVTS